MQSPAFTLPINTIDTSTISAANTLRDGTGTLVDAYIAGLTGSRVTQIEIVAIGTTTTNIVRLFLHDGTSAKLWKEISVTPITPGASTAVWSTSIVPVVPLVLPSGWKIQAATNNAESYNVIVHGGNF